MQTQTLSLDQTYDSLHWSSDRPPQLHIRMVLFHLPGRNEQDFQWIARLMGAALKFECRLVYADRPHDQAVPAVGGVRIDRLITPHTVQPLFHIGQHWHFEAPVHRISDGFGKPRWETRLWLEGLELGDGESATLMLTTNAHPVAETLPLPSSHSLARAASLKAGLPTDQPSAVLRD